MKKIFNILLILLLTLPIFLFARSFFSWQSFLTVVLSKQTWHIVSFTLYQAGISTLLAFLIALFPAFYASYKCNLLSKLLKTTLFIPFFFPVMSAVVIFTAVGNMPVLKMWHFLYSPKAIITANIFFNAPIFIYYISEALKKIPHTLSELAELDCVSKWEFFYKIEMPLLFPTLSKAFFLCFIYTFTNFAIVMNLGGIHFETLEVSIATTLIGTNDLSQALSFGIIQFLLLSVFGLATIAFKPYQFSLGEGLRRHVSKTTFLVSAMFALALYTLVLFSIVLCFYNVYTHTFSLKPLWTLFSKSNNAIYPIFLSFFNSTLIAAVTSVVIIVFVYLSVKLKSRLTEWCIFSTLGISTAFLGICLIYLNVLYGIPLYVLLIIGYFMVAMPIGYAFLAPHLESFPKELVESAKLSGASNFQVFLHIEFPNLKWVFLSGFIQIFAVIFGEFTLCYTMQIYNYIPTLPMLNYMLGSSRNYDLSNVLSGLNVIIIIVLFYVSQYIKEKKE